MILAWAVLGFALGAIPFSVVLSSRFGGGDPRAHGDRNPGAFNAWRAAGWKAGVLAMLLDFTKGALPVGLAAYVFGVAGLGLIPVALAPIVGHAFSPLLHFKGGKALAVTFGVWAGLTFGEAALVLGLLFTVFYFALRPDAWAVMFGMIGLLLYLLVWGQSTPLVAIWVGNAGILTWTHRARLRRPPSLRLELPFGQSGGPTC